MAEKQNEIETKEPSGKLEKFSLNAQNRLIDRITWRSISDQLMAVLNIEKGLFYSLIELFFRPGKAVRKHLFENRKLLVNPLRFLVLSTTAASLVTIYYVDLFEQAMILGPDAVQFNGEAASDGKHAEFFQTVITELYHKILNFSYFILTPVCALFSWLFVRKTFNVPELMVAHAFMWSMTSCISIVLTPAFAGNPILYGSMSFLMYLYVFYFYGKLINQKWKGWIKAFILTFSSIFWTFLIVAIIAVYIVFNRQQELFPDSGFF